MFLLSLFKLLYMQIEFIDRQTGKRIQENPPGESFLKFLYHNPLGKMPLEWLVKRKWLSKMYGRLMDKPSSAEKIQSFVDTYNIDMSEAHKKISEFVSFNDFFYRTLKPEARPIEPGVVSPADGKLLAFEQVNAVSTFFVKGEAFTLDAFLRDPKLAAKYQNGSLLIVRLAPNDYHRFHFPYAGTASPLHHIQGRYYSVSPYALQPNFARVFCQNKRAYTLLQTDDLGQVLLAPVGATMVGSIFSTYSPNTPLQKGDEMGYFAFGGSSILMLFEEDAIHIDADLLENTRNGMETFVKMGSKIGLVKKPH